MKQKKQSIGYSEERRFKRTHAALFAKDKKGEHVIPRADRNMIARATVIPVNLEPMTKKDMLAHLRDIFKKNDAPKKDAKRCLNLMLTNKFLEVVWDDVEDDEPLLSEVKSTDILMYWKLNGATLDDMKKWVSEQKLSAIELLIYSFCTTMVKQEDYICQKTNISRDLFERWCKKVGSMPTSDNWKDWKRVLLRLAHQNLFSIYPHRRVMLMLPYFLQVKYAKGIKNKKTKQVTNTTKSTPTTEMQ